MEDKWSNLPGDILTAITKILDSNVDLLRLRSVCSTWRSSLSPPRRPFTFPLKVPSPGSISNCCSNGYFVLNQSTVYRISPPENDVCPGNSSNGWLVKLSEISPNSFVLLVPLSADKIKYPPGTRLQHLNLLDCRISEICKSYSLDFVDAAESSKRSQPYIIRKVIVLWNFVANSDFTVLVLRYGGGMDYWKFGDEKWTPVDTNGYHFQDVLVYEGKCFAVSSTGVLVSFDSKLNMTVVSSSVGYLPQQKNYLVEMKSDLYVVSKISNPEPEFCFDYVDEWPAVNMNTLNAPFKLRIFKKCDDWNDVGYLGDMVFFLGDDVSFGVSAPDFGGFKGNCVFLTDECFYDDGVDSVYGDDTGIYDLDVRKIKSLVVAQDRAKVFWPPPAWLMPCASSSGDEVVDDLQSSEL